MTRKLVYKEEDLKIYMEEYLNGKSLQKISDEYSLNRHTLSRNLKESGVLVTQRKYTCNEEAFREINEDSAYWLGFIAADGCIHSTNGKEILKVLDFNLNARDKDHLEKLKFFLNSNAVIKEKPGVGYGEGTTIVHLEINSKKLVADLQKYGITRAKSNILKPPLIPEKYYKDWIRGYLDGDGSISLLRNGEAQVAFIGTKEVLSFVKDFFEPGLERKLHKRRKDSDKNNYQIAFGGTNLPVAILHTLYDNAHYYLERKYQKALEIYSRFEK